MKLSLNCIIIFVQNTDKLKHFYVENLNLELLEDINSEWVLLGAGKCQIGLHKIGNQYLEEGQEEFKFDNNTKLVFDIDENITTVRENLIRKNVVLKEIKTFDKYDYWLCDGEDPEGNVFQLRQKKLI